MAAASSSCPPKFDLVAQLDSLRVAILTGVATNDLDSRVRSCCAAMNDMERDKALAAANEAAFDATLGVKLLRRASMMDDDEASLNASAELVNILSGSGMHTHEFATDAVKLRIRYLLQATGTHGVIWRSELVSALACERGWGGIRVAGQNVIELGCGTALCGLACAALGAASVWLTDVDDGALKLAQSNVELNGLSAMTRVRRFDVMNQPPEEAAGAEAAEVEASEAGGEAEEFMSSWPYSRRTPPRFELVLASDIPYDFVEPAKLVEALALVLARTPSARALVVQDLDTSRSQAHQQGVRACVELAARHPELRLVASEQPTEEDPCRLVHLYAAASAPAAG